jgi:ceramide glucosyltransferase
MLALVLSGRLLIIAGMHRRFFGRSLHRPWLSIVSELLQPVHLIHALGCRTIRWRTRRYRVRDADDFVALT